RRIVETYIVRQDEIIEAAFSEVESGAVVKTLLLGFVDFLTGPDHAPGCLILNNALPIAEDHQFRVEWAEDRRVLRERLTERFRKDRRAGRGFPSDWDPAHTARLVVSLIWGIAVEAHSGASRPELQQM